MSSKQPVIAPYYDEIDGPTETIVVERRELIAEIRSGNGPKSMVEAAFEAAGSYIAENAGAASFAPIKIEFNYAGRHFTATAEEE